jgi:hypothetical protein
MTTLSLTRIVGQLVRWRVALPVFGLLWAVYLLGVHPWLRNWGGPRLAGSQVGQRRATGLRCLPTAVF